MNFIDRPSPNFDDRPDGLKPSHIVLHFTGGTSAGYALDKLTDAAAKKRVSAHYVIDEEGRVYRLVAEEKRAWHAGESFWNGLTDVNAVSIGIEISNRDRKDYPPAQLAALTALCHDLQRRYDIPPQNIIGHSDIAPDRRDDPGYHFPWAQLAQKGIGVMPKVKLRDYFHARAIARSPHKLENLFAKAGYKAASLEKLVSAFQQHYEPHVFTAPRKGGQPGKPTASTIAKLRAVARANKKHKGQSL